ncbi:hypothetical protein D3C80_1774070 [compost metagenome]
MQVFLIQRGKPGIGAIHTGWHVVLDVPLEHGCAEPMSIGELLVGGVSVQAVEQRVQQHLQHDLRRAALPGPLAHDCRQPTAGAATGDPDSRRIEP